MRLEQLESRRLLAVTADFTAGTLTVTGDANPNAVFIGRNSSNQIVVRSGDAIIKTVANADVTAIKVSLLGGNDRLEIARNVEKPSTISGGEGNDLLIGGGGKDLINGDLGNDQLRGGFGTDVLNGNDGNDILDGGEQADVMSGGGGIDTVTYAGRPGPVRVTLDNVANDGGIGAPATATRPAIPPEGDNAKNDIERIVGGNGNDRLVGTDANNTISGGGGNDVIDARGGNDVVEGGSGNDVIYGGAGDDRLYGGPGGDRLYGQDGNDSLYGRDGVKDLLDGGGGEDRAQRDPIDDVVSVEIVIP
jgi:Ca2+-binding RTX toxin-like protein